MKNMAFGIPIKPKAVSLPTLKGLPRKEKAAKEIGGNWDSVLKHLKKFAKNGASFKDIDKNWLEDFKTYLISEAKSKQINTFRKIHSPPISAR